MKHLLIVLFICFTGSVFAENSNYKSAMKRALTIHDTASSFASEKIALKAFEEVSQKYDDQWLGHYWTAYMFTQVGRLVKRTNQSEDPMAYIDNAQKHLDKAYELLENKSDENRSAIHTLQILVYKFRGWFDEPIKDKYTEMAKAEFIKAAKANPENPLLYVMSGTELINEGQQDKDLRKVYAGKILLQTAKAKFAQTKIDRSETTHWNSEWIPFWLPYADKLLAGETGS